MSDDAFGVHKIANTDNPERVLDVIFVHGLAGGSHSTWRRGKPNKEGHFFWPEELGKELGQCGVWTVGYSAGFSGLESPGMIIEKRGLNLVTQLTQKGIGDRPVVFITHSMGGLVVKSLIVASAWSANRDHKPLVKNIRGIVFCGTPHRGSALATLASFFGVTQKHVKQMRCNAEELDLAHERFTNWHRENPRLIESYAEAHPLRRQEWYGGLLPRLLVVPRASANPDLGNIYDVDADHLTLVKPNSNSIVHVGVLKFIREVIEKNEESGNQQPDDKQDMPIVLNSAVRLSIMDSFSSDLASEKEAILKDVQRKISSGQLATAETDLRSIMAKPGTWNPLPSSIKANAYRLLIEVVGNRRVGTKEAREILTDAKVACPDQRFVTSEALLAILEGSQNEMLESYPLPLTEEEWRWKMMLLINADRHADAARCIKDPASPFPINPALQSILTWAYLGIKELDAAASSNELAIQSRPDAVGNLEAKGIIKYAQAISPYATGWLNLHFPLPIEFECIKTSAVAKQALEEAAVIFEGLSKRADPSSPWQEKHLAWCLASWCNLARIAPDDDLCAKNNASKVLSQIIDLNPISPLVIHWGLIAKLPFDHSACEQALRAELVQGKLDTVELLCQLLLNKNRETEAAELMDSYKDRYADSEATRVWRYYRSQLAASLGQNVILSSILNAVADEQERLHLTALSLKHKALKKRDRDECMSAYRALWEWTHKPTDLFDACEIHLTCKRPNFVIEHANELLELLPSRRCLILVLQAQVACRKWQPCLDLIDKHQNLVLSSIEDLEILRIKCDALYGIGRFSQALQIAGLIAQKTKDKEDRISWFELARTAGDRDQMFRIANLAQEASDTPTEHRLHMAAQVAHLNPELAKSLLESAAMTSAELSPLNAAHTFFVANQLGIESELAPEVMQTAITPGGPLKPYSFEQILGIMRKNQRSIAEAEEKYRCGQIPIHSYVNAVGHPISTIMYDACPPAVDGYFASPTRLWSARIRHGRRHAFANVPSGNWKLYLDVTSLLLAHRLGVLPALEKSGAEITLSPHVPGLLLEELTKLNKHQPSREENTKELIKLINATKIGVTSQAQTEMADFQWAAGMTRNWRTAFSAAVEVDGILVDFWPLDWDTEPDHLLDVPESLQKHVTGPSGLIQGMIEAGWLEEAEVRPRIHCNTTFANPSPSIRLTHDSVVILDTAIAGCLIDVRVLHVLVARCKVQITYEEEQGERTKMRHAKYRDEVITSIDKLQIHLKQQEGRRFKTGIASDVERVNNDSTLFRCMADLSTAGRELEQIIVIEDRWLTGFINVEKAPIVGLLDVLHWLCQQGKLPQSDFYDYLHRLRLGNARYVPLTHDELAWHLKKAINLHTKKLKESPELEAIRRYYAACLLDAKSFEITRTPDDGRLELVFSVHLSNIVVGMVADIWADEADTEIRDEKAHWLLHALLTDVTSVCIRVLNPQTNEVGEGRWLENLLSIYFLRLISKKPLVEVSELVGSFASWLILSLKLPRSTYRRFFQTAKNMANDMNGGCQSKEERNYTKLLAKVLVMGLVPEGHAYLPFKKAELSQFGLHNIQRFGDFDFNREAAWTAVEKAMSGQPAKLTSADENQMDFKLSRLKTSASRLSILFESKDGAKLTLSDRILMLVAADRSVRMKFLLESRADLDFHFAKAIEEIERLSSEPKAASRIEQFVKWESSSVTHQFEQILSRWPRGNIPLSELCIAARPLASASLFRHVGIDSTSIDNSRLDVRLAEQAERLINEIGFAEAFYRHGSLPIQLPEVWRTMLFSLPQDQFEKLITSLELVSSSPMHRFQMACLLLHKDSPSQERGLALLTGLTGSDARDTWSFYRALLSWAWRSLIASKGENDSIADILFCAWLHAGIFHTRLSRPPESPKLVQHINEWESLPQQHFDIFNMISADVAKPSTFSTRWMIAHSLPKLVSIHELSDQIADRLRSWYAEVLFDSPDSQLPVLAVIRLQNECGNVLGSFLAPLQYTQYQGWLEDEQVTFTDQAKLTEQLIDSCAHMDGNQAGTLRMLSAACNWEIAPTSLHDALNGVLSTFSFDLTNDGDSAQIWGIARFIFKQRYWFKTSDDEFWLKLLKSYLEAAKKSGDNQFTEHALQCALSMSFCSIDVTKNATYFADTVIWIVRQWSLVAEEVWIPLSLIVQSQPHPIQTALWPMLAEVRALAGSDSTRLGHDV